MVSRVTVLAQRLDRAFRGLAIGEWSRSYHVLRVHARCKNPCTFKILELMSTSQEFDIIFAGGDPSTVLLVFFLHSALCDLNRRDRRLCNRKPVQPGRYLHNIFPGSKTAQFIQSRPSEHLGGRSTILPIGHCLGGGSSINCEYVVPVLTIRDPHAIAVAEYTRASHHDFDIWEQKYDIPGGGLTPCCLSSRR